MALTVHFSNRLEALADTFLAQSGQAPANPLAAQHIIVPSASMQRWLTLAYARRHGVCANVHFAYLAQWLWQQLRQVLPTVRAESPLATDALAWRIVRLLDEPQLAGLPRLKPYLDCADARMRYELACRIAQLFDRYLIYRPDWLSAWGAGSAAAGVPASGSAAADAHWQGALWRRLMTDLALDGGHPIDSFLAYLHRHGATPSLPERLSLFGLPDIPPYYLQAIDGLSRWMAIDIYCLNPCREYWFDIVQPKRLVYLRQHGDSHAETGNCLLAAWGQNPRSTLALLLDQTQGDVADDTAFVATAGTSVLGTLQNAFLDLQELAPAALAARDDRSVQIHCCHGLHRQLEVLADTLLDGFHGRSPGEAIPALDDIVVLVPDLAQAASAIDAVFGGALPERRIPFRITGVPPAVGNPLARLLDKVLALADGRFSASVILDLLAEAPVARRFAFDAADLERMRRWLQDAGIRWGQDASERGGDPRHSFAQGLTRLFLGYAMGESDATVAGLLPAGDSEGAVADLLGRFALAVETFGEVARLLAVPRTPAAWSSTLAQILDALVSVDAPLLDAQRGLQASLNALDAAWRTADHTQEISSEVLRLALADAGQGNPSAAPSGILTFAPLAAMRNLPYRWVCLLNMNDGEFPRSARPAEFDLTASSPRPGDRNPLHEDRALFLDAVLAARERLWIGYNGRSSRDNHAMPPSIVVAQLLDELAQATACACATPAELLAARQRYVIEHPLQAFSRRYFDGSEARLFSHAAEYAQALNQMAGQHAVGGKSVAAPLVETDGAYPDSTPVVDCIDDDAEASVAAPASDPPPRFFSAPLPLTVEQRRLAEQLSLRNLQAFLGHPCRFWLTQVLGIQLPRADDEIEDVEPLVLSRRGESTLFDALVAYRLRHADLFSPANPANPTDDTADALRYTTALNELPSGALGAAQFEALWPEVNGFVARLAPDLARPVCPAISCQLAFSGNIVARIGLSGALVDVRDKLLVRYATRNTRSSDLLRLWVDFLTLGAVSAPGSAISAVHHGRDGSYRLAAAPDPHSQAQALARLADLVGLFEAGLQQPLPFFPRSSGLLMEKSWNAARAAWVGGDWPESDDAYYRLALRGIGDPLSEAFGPPGAATFVEVTQRILQPLYAVLTVSAAESLS